MKYLLIDGHALFAEGLVLLLERTLPDLDCVRVQDIAQALQVVRQQTDLDGVLFDPGSCQGEGLAAICSLRQTRPDLPVLILCADTDRASILAAIGAGAAGFIPKNSSIEQLGRALQLLSEGLVYLPVAAIHQDPGMQAGVACVDGPDRAGAGAGVRALGLSERQFEVMGLILQGLSGKRIGQQLGISDNTVKAHTRVVLRTFKVSSRTQLVLEASRLGILAPNMVSGTRNA